FYRRNYPLTAAARSAVYLNPGNATVSAIAHEPRVSLAVLEEMLAPYLSSGRLTVLTGHAPVAADVERDTLRAVTVGSRTIRARWFLDATELGDLLPLAKVEFVTGYESRKQTGEERAPEQPQPDNHQAFTVCFAMDYLAGEDHTIDKPAEYAFWRDYTPPLKPAWPGKLFSFTYSNP
ncbi:MAG: FAD-dependent oxidoreductase, partial [Bryobacterales bacterium]|nr:FAD-dependent oxidoreductase [Bryobacterales bacterium]